MIYLTLQGQSLNTDLELTSPQRHVLQKLLAWEHLGLSLEEFALRKGKALQQGWDNLGPVAQTPALTAVIEDLTKRLAMFHGQVPAPNWLKAQAWPGRYAGGGLEAGAREDGRLRVVLHDGADLVRGRFWIPLAEGQSTEQALDLAAEDLRQGRGDLAAQVRGLGLSLRS